MLKFDINKYILSGVDMEWAKPIYFRKEVNEAGKYLTRIENIFNGEFAMP